MRIEDCTACPVGCYWVAGYNGGDVAITIKKGIEDESDVGELGCFLQVHAYRIAVQTSGYSLWLCHHGMISTDGTLGGATGHDGLQTSTVAHEVVVLDVADCDNRIGFRHAPGYLHWRAGRSSAQGNDVMGIAVHHCHPLPHRLTHQTAALVLGMRTV